ncbi:MAG TPA: hypothetical protein VL346_03675 [Acidobacteriaceae bacterium]|nr:hypothetical protein [Acidobacteriaceae bacterium]
MMDSYLVPAILVVLTGPAVLFLLWVLYNLHLEIQRGRAKRATPIQDSALRRHLLNFRRNHRL